MNKYEQPRKSDMDDVLHFLGLMKSMERHAFVREAQVMLTKITDPKAIGKLEEAIKKSS